MSEDLFAPTRRAPRAASPVPQVVVQVDGNRPSVHDLTAETIRLGRDESNEIHLGAPYVSRYQAELRRTETGYALVPAPQATTQIIFHGRRVTEPVELAPGDFFRIPGREPGEIATVVYRLPTPPLESAGGSVDLIPGHAVRIGRADDNDLGVGNPTIASYHAEITSVDAGVLLTDAESGVTQVNGSPVTGAVWLQPDDVVSIGSLNVTVRHGRIEYADASAGFLIGTRRARAVPADLLEEMAGAGGVLLEARNLHKTVRGGADLLPDISLRIRPREFVILVGTSGAGKSTLLNALSGYKPANDGHVTVDGVDLYQNFETYRPRIGYVPQRDIVHMQLTVFEALDYAAQMRLPPDTTEEARRRRIEEVLVDLDLTERRDQRVADLSGGQLKRVSIGVELITSPQLFFLDEPTSGLDPSTETSLMQLLRNLADQGRTIVLITHATKNVMLADKVIFMVRGGRIAWYGPPAEALSYFDTYRTQQERDDTLLDFDAIYSLLEDRRRGDAEEWAERFKAHPAYRRYIATPLGLTRPSAPAGELPQGKTDAPPPIPQVSAFRQMLILTSRNLRLLGRDRFALILMLVAAPILASLDFLITSRSMFDPTLGDPLRITITTGTMAVNALLVGALAQTREIIKDTDIYRRERLVNLGIAPYVLSKVGIAAVLALYQALAWVGIRYLAVDMPGGFHTALEIYVTMALAILAGMTLGLLASAVAPTEDSVTLIVAILIVPQVLFNGSLLPLPLLSAPARAQTAIMPARWTFELLTTQSGVGKSLVNDPGWQLPKAQRLALTTAQTTRSACLGTNIFTQCNFPGIRAYAPPADASPALKAAAVARAEGQLETEWDNFGDIYNVNVLGHWAILAGLIVAIVLGVVGILRTKDRF